MNHTEGSECEKLVGIPEAQTEKEGRTAMSLIEAAHFHHL